MKSKILASPQKTLIMGIVNITSDSFSGDGILSHDDAIAHGEDLILKGADILDIGGESSRPGSIPISAREELDRIIPIIKHFSRMGNIVISVDTYKPEVAEKALAAGAHIINDITGLEKREMAEIISSYGAKVVIMHMKGLPLTMQNDPSYSHDVIMEICDFFTERIDVAIESGISKDDIILDPGIGFGKTLEHNLLILKRVDHFKQQFSLPVLIGTSRKSFIGTLTGKSDPVGRVFGTAATVALAISAGADIVRVHDVKEMKDVAVVSDAIKNAK